jgi:hypothetical protein
MTAFGYIMKYIRVTNSDGADLLLSEEHIVSVCPANKMVYGPNARTVVAMVNGDHYAIRDTTIKFSDGTVYLEENSQ